MIKWKLLKGLERGGMLYDYLESGCIQSRRPKCRKTNSVKAQLHNHQTRKNLYSYCVRNTNVYLHYSFSR